MALIEKLEAIGDAIRAKTGSTELLTLDAMPLEIASIETGGGSVDVEPIVLSGNCDNACSGAMAAAYINNFGNTVSTNDITSANNMFYRSTLERIPFALNFKSTTSASLRSLFERCEQLKEIPAINNAYPDNINLLFSYCKLLRYLPDDLGTTWNWDYLHTYSYAYLSNVFDNCLSLRKVPEYFLSNLWGKSTSSSYLPYKNMFYYCYALDEVNNVPVHQATLTSNCFGSTFNACHRVKNITFAINEDGTAKTANWKSQTIDLSSSIGWANTEGNVLNYNSGISKADLINNTTHSYNLDAWAAMDSNPNWYSTMYEYSRYDKQSAINTINSLPDTSAYLAANGGTNTIKFKARQGSATRAGAIETMTAEQIAMAAAKGWTVSLV